MLESSLSPVVEVSGSLILLYCTFDNGHIVGHNVHLYFLYLFTIPNKQNFLVRRNIFIVGGASGYQARGSYGSNSAAPPPFCSVAPSRRSLSHFDVLVVASWSYCRGWNHFPSATLPSLKCLQVSSYCLAIWKHLKAQAKSSSTISIEQTNHVL